VGHEQDGQEEQGAQQYTHPESILQIDRVSIKIGNTSDVVRNRAIVIRPKT